MYKCTKECRSLRIDSNVKSDHMQKFHVKNIPLHNSHLWPWSSLLWSISQNSPYPDPVSFWIRSRHSSHHSSLLSTDSQLMLALSSDIVIDVVFFLGKGLEGSCVPNKLYCWKRMINLSKMKVIKIWWEFLILNTCIHFLYIHMLIICLFKYLNDNDNLGLYE